MKISGEKIWLNEKFVPASLSVEGGKIINISQESRESDIDFGSNRVIPGLIDVHTHGYGGGDASDGDPDTIRNWVKYYPSEGVTTFLPGTVTRSEARLISALRSIRCVIEELRESGCICGAGIHGIFFQGPYTSHEFKGAYDPYLIQRPDVNQFKMFNEVSGHNIRLVGLAVEKDENHALLKYCVSEGIMVSMGHSGASFEEAEQAAKEGALTITHCFNNMIGLHHREPGLPGAALSIDSIYAEVIADGVHIHPAVVKIIGRSKGKDKLIVITDSSRYKGLPPGRYESVDRKVTIGSDGVGRLDSGKLAGSCVTLIDSVRNLMEIAGLPEATAINAATSNPANMLGIGDRKGYLAPGYDADIAVYDDNYKILQTFCMGQKML
ncbi:MAG: N-acetylglucosamine-6-phosphate deacetylase [Synergistaceae bacterium]|jgi:N-acetylglucosamine-6-phosphate deacetylase|nr:N-acetylglucosamine-6-phosphate deacetylase [Synergistaceae bacterium]